MPNWPGQAVARFDAELASAGLRRIGDVVWVRDWALSAVLWAGTTGGGVYYKESTGDGTREADVLAYLSCLNLEVAPVLVGAGHARPGWCTLGVDGVNGTALPEQRRGDALAALAHAQRTGLPHAATLPARGFRNLRGDALAGLLDDGVLARSDVYGPALAAALGARAECLSEICARIDELPPGPSLVHGDLHAGNWLAVPGSDRIVLLDWAEAGVGHPFLDVAPALRSARDPDARAAATTHYLRQWAGLIALPEARRVLALVEPAAALSKLATYLRIHEAAPPRERGGWLERVRMWAHRLL